MKAARHSLPISLPVSHIQIPALGMFARLKHIRTMSSIEVTIGTVYFIGISALKLPCQTLPAFVHHARVDRRSGSNPLET